MHFCVCRKGNVACPIESAARSLPQLELRLQTCVVVKWTLELQTTHFRRCRHYALCSDKFTISAAKLGGSFAAIKSTLQPAIKLSLALEDLKLVAKFISAAKHDLLYSKSFKFAIYYYNISQLRIWSLKIFERELYCLLQSARDTHPLTP